MKPTAKWQSAASLSLFFCTLLLAYACSPQSGERTDVAAANQSAPAANDTGSSKADASYSGSQACAGCHAEQYQAWQRSHHHAAMQPATAQTVLADFDGITLQVNGHLSSFSLRDGQFFIRTDGPQSELQDYRVVYTFGLYPLQQYLLDTGQGRMQASALAWDGRPAEQGGQSWFHLQEDAAGKPDDVLHWTRDAFNWNAMCADCHSTAVQKNYSAEQHSYQTGFAEVSVGCEACHGKASAHIQAPLENRLTTPGRQQINTCAQCHSRRGQLAEGFTPSQNYFDFYQPSLLEEGLYFADGQILDEVFVYGSFLQSRMHGSGVVCSDCHEPHSGETHVQGNGLCTQCHNPAGNPRFTDMPTDDYDSSAHHFHLPQSEAAQCVSCHMPARTYMQVDARRDHRFSLPRPDLSASLGVPNPCTDCHEDRNDAWAAREIARRFGPQRPEHFAGILQRARRGEPAVELALAELAMDSGQADIVRATAMSLMASYSGRASTDALLMGQASAQPLLRIGAVRGLSQWPVPRRWAQLKPLLRDPLLAVRVEATRALLDAYPALTEAQRQYFEPALKEWQNSLLLNADRAESQSGLATLYRSRGDWAAAEAALNKALQLNPQWVPALVNLSDLYRASGRDEQGGALLDQALALVPDSAETLMAKGLWLVRQQQNGEALQLFERAVLLSPGHARFAYIYAVALHSEGKSEQALQVVDAQLQYTPDNTQLLQAGAGMARDSGDSGRLQTYLQRLPQNQP